VVEAVDLSTKTSLPASDERKHTADPNVQSYECIPAGDQLQGNTL